MKYLEKIILYVFIFLLTGIFIINTVRLFMKNNFLISILWLFVFFIIYLVVKKYNNIYININKQRYIYIYIY